MTVTEKIYKMLVHYRKNNRDSNLSPILGCSIRLAAVKNMFPLGWRSGEGG